MQSDLEKLHRLFPYWIEHNEEHAQKFEDWARRAREIGLEEVAARLTKAVQLLRDANRELEAGYEWLKVSKLPYV